MNASSADDPGAPAVSGARMEFTLPAAPEPVRTVPNYARLCYGLITDFFCNFLGVTRPRPRRESQHDSHRSELLPPPYADAELPAYSTQPNTEPNTLAMHLFKFGFLFPPLWILGAFILIYPLAVPANFEPSKSMVERQQLLGIIRDTELRWAQRCAWALFVLIVLASVAAAIVFVVQHS